MWNQSRIGGFVTPASPRHRPQTGTSVGECGQLGVVSSAYGFKVSADQRRDVGTSLRHRSEHLSPSGSRLDVADANLQVSLAVFAAADEGRIQGDSDRRRRGCRHDRGVIAKLLANFQRMMSQCLGAPPVSIGSRCSSTPAATR